MKIDTNSAISPRSRGFSLLEVLVALLIISFGMLGIVGMQALAISNTGVAGYRSIAATQAYSIAAAMTANRAFWAETNNPLNTDTSSITTSAITVSAGSASSLGTPPSSNCSTASCTPLQMAQYDLQQWGGSTGTGGIIPTGLAQLPSGAGSVQCKAAVTAVTGNTPQTCQIIVKWREKSLAQNQGSGVTSDVQQDFELVVQP